MPKNLIIIALLSILGNEINAQKLVFDLNGRMNFTQPGDHTTSETYDGNSGFWLNDTTLVRTYSTYTIDITNDYISNTGYEVNGLFTIKLSDRFSLRTGLGVTFGSYSIGSVFDIRDEVILKVDTVYQEKPEIGPGIGSSLCDCYENSYADVSLGNNRRIHQEMINLSMPADLGYDIIPGKLSIRAGMFFQTPLYAAAKREYIDIEMTTMGDTTKCRYVKKTEKNTAATGVSNFQWGVSSWISYKILPQLQLEIGARKHVNDMYVKEEYQFFSNDNNSFKPLTFSAGVSYRLYKGVAPK